MKKKKLKLKRNVGRAFLGSIISLVLFFGITYGVGKNILLVMTKTKEKAMLDQQLNELKEEESVLEVDVKKLQDPEYIARYAREKFLYSKEEEFIIRIPGQD